MHHAQEAAYNEVLFAHHFGKKTITATLPVTNGVTNSVDYKTIVRPTVEMEKDKEKNDTVIMRPHVIATPSAVQPRPVVVDPRIYINPAHEPQEPDLKP
jgi:hypothetical protein